MTPIIQPQQQPGGLIEALKDGLLQFEIDRVQGSIPDDEYAAPSFELTRFSLVITSDEQYP